MVPIALQKEIKNSGSLDTSVKGQSSKLSVNEDSLNLNPLLLTLSTKTNTTQTNQFEGKTEEFFEI